MKGWAKSVFWLRKLGSEKSLYSYLLGFAFQLDLSQLRVFLHCYLMALRVYFLSDKQSRLFGIFFFYNWENWEVTKYLVWFTIGNRFAESYNQTLIFDKLTSSINLDEFAFFLSVQNWQRQNNLAKFQLHNLYWFH